MDGLWFNDEKSRRIILRSVVLQVGKAPTKRKTMKMLFTMHLDDNGEQQVSNLPEWLEKARDFVMRNGETITAGHVVKMCNVTMGDANLFKKTPTEAPKSQLDHFVVKQIGSKDEPDTVLTFEMRTQFATDLWNWCGQQGGEEFDVVFDVIGQEAGETEYVANEKPTDDAAASQDEEDDDAGAEVCETCGYPPEDCGCGDEEEDATEDADEEEEDELEGQERRRAAHEAK